VNGELLFVDCDEDGGKKAPPLKVKCEENGAAPILLLLPSATCSPDAYEFISFLFVLKGLRNVGGERLCPKASLFPLPPSPDPEAMTIPTRC